MPWARSNASPEGCAQGAYTAGESRGSVTATARRERGAQGRGSSPGRAVIRYSSRCPTTAATGRDIELALSVALADLPPARAVIEAGPALAVVEPPHGGPWPRGGRRQPPPGRADRPQPPQDRPSRPAGAELPSCTAEASRAPSGAVAAGGGDRRTDCPHRSSRPGDRGAGEAHPETAALRQVTGVGPITALTFVLTIEDRGRFPKNREVAAYLGLVPRQRDSGKREPQPGISRSGDPGLRPLRVQPAHYILGLCGPDTDLRRWGGRHAGTGARERAAVAVARRLSVLLLALWKRGEVFEPLGHAIARDAALRAAATTRDDRDRWKRRPRAAAKRRAALGPEATRSCPGRFRSRSMSPRGRRA